MKDIPFKVSSAAGNTFAILDTIQNSEWKKLKSLPEQERTQLICRLCLDASPFVDGVFFLEINEQNPDHFQWDFFNRDGSIAEMCGNAARCAFDYLFECRSTPKGPLLLKTKIGNILGTKLADGQIQVQWEIPSLDIQHMKVDASGNVFDGFYINTGVPHFVVRENITLEQASLLRHHPVFGERGTNVTAIERLDADTIQAWTYERGVEKQTPSCGTGAVAVAIWAQKKVSAGIHTFYIKMPGGTLQVDLYSEQNRKIRLTSFVVRHPDNFFSRSYI